ncbi:MAG: YicC family protein [Acidaminococcaceae bacterium]|nr:YicC family protein [Acidaminococcaceae bacterium]MBQ5344272.1 YicC family protein [Acidaminococcaceae bacterium]MBQ9257172.1 YicC family protein [Acidaminococcaceae bacterium]MBQ9319466.1 YicC family protein [Acidaminococcaceae bacterium]MBR1512449.1 YicC family protein [Acidaminococcaceae bacterium]
MTGFGRGSFEEENFSVTVEIKSVNHRYNEIAIRLPHFLNPLEDKIRKTILASISRGRVDVFVTARYTATGAVNVSVDKPLALAYHTALLEVGDAIGITSPNISDQAEILYLARCPDVITAKEGLFDCDGYWPKIKQAVDQAVGALVSMREAEGKNIVGDFYKRLDLIEQHVLAIEKRSPLAVAEYQAKLTERLDALLADKKISADPDRVLQEVAIFADRVSITEEIVRLKSHIRQFRLILESAQPVGRKLDFLVQEFNREANTIGSKANDFELAKTVVEVKAEIEKIREQIQNIE